MAVVLGKHALLLLRTKAVGVQRGLAGPAGTSRVAAWFGTLEALHEALTWLVASGQVDVGGQEF